MNLYRLLTTAAAVALFTGAANAQTVAETPAAAEPAPAPAAAEAAAATPAPAATAAPAPAPAPAVALVVAKGDLVETAKASGQFTTFVKALDKTNLTAVLQGNRNLTVFAPTDAAFAALPAGELDRLMKTENAAELQRMLVYHVVNAPVDTAKIKGAKGPVKTVAGTDLLLDGSGDSLKANSAAIVQADVRTSNGILHVVDRVLSPTDPAIAAARVEAAQNAVQPADAPAS
ncbi:MAG TPA: fasciclin domain-containing protein [Caulobacteraceae bacterium]|nr:fasciclin domain-containing protein [Caulobacteraceae bacterium]